jgi:hypothetical protein
VCLNNNGYAVKIRSGTYTSQRLTVYLVSSAAWSRVIRTCIRAYKIVWLASRSPPIRHPLVPKYNRTLGATHSFRSIGRAHSRSHLGHGGGGAALRDLTSATATRLPGISRLSDSDPPPQIQVLPSGEVL